jgi:acyl-CoA synthetase (AMP-forming)/AMP-acid ligase II
LQAVSERTLNLADPFEVVADAAPDTDLDSLRAHVRTLVAGYKVPKEIHVLDALQRTPAGKPDDRWAKARALELGAEHAS